MHPFFFGEALSHYISAGLFGAASLAAVSPHTRARPLFGSLGASLRFSTSSGARGL
jgi:hypothetical protein